MNRLTGSNGSVDTADRPTIETKAPSAPMSGAPTPTPAAKMIADLTAQDIAAVEASLVSVRDAQSRGDKSVISNLLTEQAVLLQALGIKLMRVAGNEKVLARMQVFANLSLRAFEGARKTLGMLAGGQPTAQTQTNVQVNVSGNKNELLEVGLAPQRLDL